MGLKKFQEPYQLQKDGPLMQACTAPQLMLVKHNSTTFLRNKRRNEELHKEFMIEWRKKHPKRSY